MRMLVSRAWPTCFVAVPIILACGAGGGGDLRGGGTNSGGGQGSGSGGTGDDIIFGGGGEGSADVPTGVDECGGDVYQGEGRELDMFIMMDRSGSMIGFGLSTFGQNVWVPIGSAIGEFVVRPEAAGIGVGIGFFPNDQDECDVNLYATPTAQIAPLPGNANAIQQAIANNVPLIGQTPTLPAMQGAMQYTQSWATQNPSKKVILVLATDGEPNVCNSDIPGVSQVAAAGLAGTPSIPTYVIGIGNVAGLNEVAVAGGTNQAFIVATDPAVASQQFLDAMNQIRGLALPCDYGIPSGANADPTKVNLDYTPPGGEKLRIGNAPDASQCDPSLGGWYYDDNTNPTRIYACPASCSLFGATTGGVISVVVGCDTVPIR